MQMALLSYGSAPRMTFLSMPVQAETLLGDSVHRQGCGEVSSMECAEELQQPLCHGHWGSTEGAAQCPIQTHECSMAAAGDPSRTGGHLAAHSTCANSSRWRWGHRTRRQCWQMALAVALLLPQIAGSAKLFASEQPGTEPSTLRAWMALLENTKTDAFELAFASTYLEPEEGNATATLAHFDSMISWLDEAHQDTAMQIHELQNYLVREVVHDALQLAAGAYDEGETIKVLEGISSRLMEVSTQYGYPVARRVILGCLVKHRVQNGQPFSRPVQSLVDRVLLQLFQLHKRSGAQKGTIQFFHISKSGGTNLCMAAQSNNCSSEGFDPNTNCLIHDFSDAPRWVSPAAHKYVFHRLTGSDQRSLNMKDPWYINFHKERKYKDNCDQRQKKLSSRGFDFFANEFTLPVGEKWLCKEFVNLMMWRHPLDRLHSQISWIQKLYKERFTGADLSKAFAGRTSGFWDRLLPAGVNNYYIRSLLGTRFFEYPIITIDKPHIQRAKLQVLLHDILLILEKKDFTTVALKAGLGWATGLQDSNIRSSSSIKSQISMPVDYDTLKARNAPDVEVYNFAQEMATLDVLLWHFIGEVDQQLGLHTSSRSGCGYVSSGRTTTAGDAADATSSTDTNDTNGSSSSSSMVAEGTLLSGVSDEGGVALTGEDGVVAAVAAGVAATHRALTGGGRGGIVPEEASGW